jgi:tetratricopeptide (TPR) repeat protein
MRVGQAEIAAGSWPEAVHRVRAALRLRRTHLGPDHIQTAYAMQALGGVLLIDVKDPDIDTAQRLLERSHTILRDALGPASPIVVSTSLGLAVCELKRGRLAAALSHVQLEATSASPVPDASNAPLKLYLAASLRKSGAALAALSVIAPLVLGLIEVSRTSAFLLEKALTIQLEILRDLDRHDAIIALGDSITAQFAGNEAIGPGLVAIATNFAAQVHFIRGDSERAERLIRYAISLAEVGFESRQEVAPLYRNLKDILEATDRRAEANGIARKLRMLSASRG